MIYHGAFDATAAELKWNLGEAGEAGSCTLVGFISCIADPISTPLLMKLLVLSWVGLVSVLEVNTAHSGSYQPSDEAVRQL